MLGLKTMRGVSIMMGMVALVAIFFIGIYVWFIYGRQMPMPSYSSNDYVKFRPKTVVNEQSVTSGIKAEKKSVNEQSPTSGIKAEKKSVNEQSPISGIIQAEKKLVNEQCPTSGIQAEKSYLHYPRPKTFSRAECACNPVHFFAILSMQRSGSGWFETLLNSHINVSSNGEIFKVKERRDNISALFNTLDNVYNLDWFSSAAKNECTSAVGFKWMLNQGVLKYHKDIVNYFKRRGVLGIFLMRRNLLRRMISNLANTYDRESKQLSGTHKAHVHSREEADELARYKPRIDASSLLSDIKRTEAMATEALEHFKSTRHILVYYEDIVNNRTKLMDVLDFLKLPQQKLVSRQVKIHTRPLPELVENWKDVYGALKKTKYRNFLRQ